MTTWEVSTSSLAPADTEAKGREGWEPFAAYFVPATSQAGSWPVLVWRRSREGDAKAAEHGQ